MEEQGNPKKLKVVTSSDSAGIACSSSDLGKNSTVMQSPSKSSICRGGFEQTDRCMRSVLMHPICFPLLIHLNDIDREEYHPEYVWTLLDGFAIGRSDDRISRENVFGATTMDWEHGETDFTEKLLFNINQRKIGASLFTTTAEKHIAGKEKGRGKVDFIFHTTEIENTKKKPTVVALFEFGINNSIWWVKQDQVLKYVEILRSNKNAKYKFDQPMLISVITINEPKTKSNKIKKNAKESVDDKERITRSKTLQSNRHEFKTNEDVAHTSFEARFGVFLCIPKGDNNFRISLLWRHDATTLKDASTQFGKILYAVQLCSYMHEHCSEVAIRYKYLGPNCCKIGDSVSFIHANRNCIQFVTQCSACLLVKYFGSRILYFFFCFLCRRNVSSCSVPMIIDFDRQIVVRIFTSNQMFLVRTPIQLPRLFWKYPMSMQHLTLENQPHLM